MSPEPQKTVSVGLATKLGITLTTVGGVAATIAAAGANLHMPAEALAILTAVAGVTTLAGRMYQAARL